MEKITILQLLKFIPVFYYEHYISHWIIAKTWVTLVTLDRDVTRVPVTISPVLPLTEGCWTLGSTVNTLVVTRATYLFSSTPGAVTVSAQIEVNTISL